MHYWRHCTDLPYETLDITTHTYPIIDNKNDTPTKNYMLWNKDKLYSLAMTRIITLKDLCTYPN
jgi:hypothetical protein